MNCECLEPRRLLSFSLANGTLSINGSQIEFWIDPPESPKLHGRVDGEEFALDRDDISKIEITGTAGNDSVNSGSYPFTSPDIPMLIRAGAGDDSIRSGW